MKSTVQLLASLALEASGILAFAAPTPVTVSSGEPTPESPAQPLIACEVSSDCDKYAAERCAGYTSPPGVRCLRDFCQIVCEGCGEECDDAATAVVHTFLGNLPGCTKSWCHETTSTWMSSPYPPTTSTTSTTWMMAFQGEEDETVTMTKTVTKDATTVETTLVTKTKSVVESTPTSALPTEAVAAQEQPQRRAWYPLSAVNWRE